MIGRSDCPVTQNDWCVRRCRLSVVKDHDGPCPSLCVFESVYVHVLACLSVLLVYQCARRHAWVFCMWFWASDWCHVPRCNKCLSCSCCVLFGTDGNLSPLLINQTWYNPKETVEPEWEASPATEISIQSIWYLTNLWKTSSLSSYSKSNIFFVSTCLSPVQTPLPFLCSTPDLPYDLWLGQCGDEDL